MEYCHAGWNCFANFGTIGLGYKKAHYLVVKNLLIAVLTGFTILGVYFIAINKEKLPVASKVSMSYHASIIKTTLENNNFRRVLFTGKNTQLVVMSIPPGGEVGKETHKYTEQTLFFLAGTGEGEMDGKKFSIAQGDVVVVVSGTEHNFINTGKVPLKIYTVYGPPNHIDGRVHATKADADTDTADEAVGETPPQK